jgi:superfamily II DNA/RNA helicase
MNFEETGLSEVLVKRLTEIGFTTPTPIQQKAIPIALRGQDIIGMAQTGTGKTAAFLLPILNVQNDKAQKSRNPSVLILEPTRELAFQVQESLKRFDPEENLKSVLLIGGDPMGMQERALKKPHNIIIATPGRLLDFMDRGKLLMYGVQHVVIDEADRMLDMGFIPDVDKILAVLPKTRQTLLFSATMTPDIRKLVEQYMMLPKTVEVKGEKSKASIEQTAILVNDINKREALRKILREHPKLNVVVFCNRKRDIDELKQSLSRHKFSVGAMHGDMDQEMRNKSLQAFKAGEIDILIASDVLARGVDIEGLGMVVNFNVPLQVEDYIHRIGRTGRADMKGLAFTLVNVKERTLLKNIETHLNATLISETFVKEKRAKKTQEKSEIKAIEVKTTEEKAPKNTAPKAVAKKPAHPVRERHPDRANEKMPSGHEPTGPVVGFGAILPGFMAQKVTLPKPFPEGAEAE